MARMILAVITLMVLPLSSALAMQNPHAPEPISMSLFILGGGALTLGSWVRRKKNLKK